MVVDGHDPGDDGGATSGCEDELWRLENYEIEWPPEWGRVTSGAPPATACCWSGPATTAVSARPVSFWSLFASHRALPVRLKDCDLGGDVVRARLDHAPGFVEDLVHWEHEALPHVGETAKALEMELDDLYKQCGLLGYQQFYRKWTTNWETADKKMEPSMF